MPIEPVNKRGAPRCYRGTAAASVRQRTEIDANAILLTLSFATAIVVFLLAYRGFVL